MLALTQIMMTKYFSFTKIKQWFLIQCRILEKKLNQKVVIKTMINRKKKLYREFGDFQKEFMRRKTVNLFSKIWQFRGTVLTLQIKMKKMTKLIKHQYIFGYINSKTNKKIYISDKTGNINIYSTKENSIIKKI